MVWGKEEGQFAARILNLHNARKISFLSKIENSKIKTSRRNIDILFCLLNPEIINDNLQWKLHVKEKKILKHIQESQSGTH